MCAKMRAAREGRFISALLTNDTISLFCGFGVAVTVVVSKTPECHFYSSGTENIKHSDP